jgi:hypothetical protein
MTAPLIPPRYVNVPSAVAFSNDLPDPLFRTYTRLVGLAWRDELQSRLPQMHIDDLAAICHLKRRAMRLHLQDLVRHNLVTCDGDQNGFRIRIVSPATETPVQNFALPVLPSRDAGDQSPAAQEPVQNFALDNPTVQANLVALAEFGVNPRVQDARKVAVRPHVTPDLVRAWGQHLAQRPDTRNLPGRLLYTLSTNTSPPRPETRGGDRSNPQTTSPLSQPPLPLLSSRQPDPGQNDEQTGASDDGNPSTDDDDRANLLLFLAQEQDAALDRKLAYALVQPYTREQIVQMVYYARTARGLTRPLNYAIKCLRAGDLPDVTLSRAERELYEMGVHTCPGDCARLHWADELCQECHCCAACCACNAGADVIEPAPDVYAASQRPQPRPADPSQPLKPNQVWQAALGELELQMTRETFNTWLKPARFQSLDGGVFIIGVENAYAQAWLSNCLLATVQRTLTSIVGSAVEVKFVVWSKSTSASPGLDSPGPGSE